MYNEWGGAWRPKQIWINSNPTALFEAKTINLNTTDFDYIIIQVIRNNSSTINRRFSYFLEKGTSSDLNYSDRSGDTIRTWNRILDNSNVNSIAFDSCYLTEVNVYTNGFSNEINNNLLVPYKIYGFKY